MSKRAVIYVRLSRHRGADDPSTSPERQREACQSYADAQGWEVVQVVEDLDVSGTEKGDRLDRPGLQTIRSLWGAVDVVLFLKIDRLARSVADFHAFAVEAHAKGAELVSVRDGLDLTTPSGRFVATILAAFAEMEGAVIRERTIDGLRGAARLGRFTGGAPPYGYRSAPHPSGKGRTLEVDQEQAEALRTAARMVLDGDPVARSARWMTENAPKPNRAADWSAQALRWALTGDAALGRITSNGKLLRDADGYPLTPFPAIFTPAESSALRDALKRSSNGRQRASHGPRLLSGILLCSGCRTPLTATKRPGDVDLYRCYTKGHGGRCDQPVAVSAPAVERYVEDEYLSMEGDHELFEERVLVEAPDTASLEEAITATLADLATEATPEAFGRLRDLQAERERIASTSHERQVELVATGETVADAWARMNVSARRDKLAAFYAPLVLAPGRRGKRGFDPARLPLIPAHE